MGLFASSAETARIRTIAAASNRRAIANLLRLAADISIGACTIDRL